VQPSIPIPNARPSRVDGLTTAEVAVELGVDRGPSEIVHIHWDRLEKLASVVARTAESRTATPAAWDDDLFWNVSDPLEERSQYFAMGNAINFRFWSVDQGEIVAAEGVIGGSRLRGSMYMWRCLRRTREIGALPMLNADFLAQISDDEFDLIFTDEDGVNPLAIGREDRIANLRDLGVRLNGHWGGQFFNMVLAAEGSLVEFAKHSSGFRAFDDPLFKLTMVNAILHSGSSVYVFDDEPLPAIDYHLLRHLLRQGVLSVTEGVEQKLKTGQLLTADEGYELRRVALTAFAELAARTELSGEVIDNMFWLNRTNCRDEPVCLDPATARQCPFLDVCAQFVDYRLPLELTRYY
jgi:hypothetical protein